MLKISFKLVICCRHLLLHSNISSFYNQTKTPKMADGVLSNVVGDIITKLGSRALHEIGLWWGVKGELKKLEATVSSIRNVLLDAEEQQKLNRQVKGWLERLEEVVYDADDLVDDFATEALRRRVMTGNRMTKEVCLFFSSSNQLVYGFKMGHKIKAIRERLADIEGDRKFKLEVRTDQERIAWRDQTESSLPEVVIGREGDKKAITELVLSSNGEECVSVLSIVGMGGLGKTTLAQIIFNDELIKNSFERRIWVCVSDPFDVKMVVRKILESATEKKPEDLELEALKSQLGRIIDGKKYLLVLDDVWNENREKWQNLKRLLVGGSSGSKILITTRSKKVADISSTMAPHVLEGLSRDESWSLFLHVALEGQEPKHANVREIGEEILKKCCGVPLAIKTIASLLYEKNPETEWPLFLRNELSRISQDDNDIVPTLKLSYDQLPSHLKHCFAYCALCPKDYEIDVKTLIHLWVAQGFVEAPITSDRLEDIGLEYFMKLWWRSFFQEVKRDRFGNIESCKMHDLMHDLATTVGEIRIRLVNSDAPNIDEKIRHVALKLDVAPQEVLNIAKKSRSFLLLEKHDYNKLFIHKNLWCIRAYDMNDCGIEKVDSCIKMLKHLRYFGVSGNVKLRTLPNSITDLLNLRVLNVSNCRRLKELPKDIKKLVNLRHLYCEGCKSLTHMPRGLGQLTSLQTLSQFVVAKGHISSKDVGKINELNKLNNLRGSLEITNLGFVDNEIVNVNLKEKPLLQSLVLHWKESWEDSNVDRDEMAFQNLLPHPNLKELNVVRYGGRRFPSWFSSLTNLVQLHIWNGNECQHLPPMDQIPSLQHLEILGFDDLEYMEIEGQQTSFFPSLKTLNLHGCPKLKGWQKKRDDSTVLELLKFPCLSYFSCNNCPSLTSIPQFPSLDESLNLQKASPQLVHQIFTPSISSSSSIIPPLSKLKHLSIVYIEELESLPRDGLRNLTCLQRLTIGFCPALKCLPQEMRSLTSLRELNIEICPQLKERCGNKKGADWEFISHIQNIKVDRQTIQKEGRYLLDDEASEVSRGRGKDVIAAITLIYLLN
ncbi:putative disease resistance protein RGA3 [Manihot esculenta]|uniref:putative disease resistance protein RGA3 n=1 Tax=Manihot esculenta TaxID=3983 RepID=UPI001CC7D88C|nr:putative disease resistance protein RGA3 [Manihot esculenta]